VTSKFGVNSGCMVSVRGSEGSQLGRCQEAGRRTYYSGFMVGNEIYTGTVDKDQDDSLSGEQ
jgi:hypothetical protein